jgi:RNA polymerase sigma factor (sigma-70 family)
MTEEQLIHDNMGLVISLAKRFNPANAQELDEYIQAGRIGLLLAIRKHDPEKGALSTIAWNYIRREIRNHIKFQTKFKYQEIHDNIVSERTDEFWEHLPDNLTSQEKEAIQLKKMGLTVAEIKDRLQLTTCNKTTKVLKNGIKKIQNANST